MGKTPGGLAPLVAPRASVASPRGFGGELGFLAVFWGVFWFSGSFLVFWEFSGFSGVKRASHFLRLSTNENLKTYYGKNLFLTFLV